MIRAFQIFQEMDSATARGIFSYLREEQRDIYNSALDTLATNRRLRPIFMRRKPPEAQYDWLEKTTKLKMSDGVDEHLLQLWLLKKHQPMLIAFLDGVGIEHDGEGAVEDLPDDLDEAKLKKTVEGLLEEYPEDEVRIYLHTFQLQTANGWDSLKDLLESHPKLKFGPAEEESKPASEEE